jgi:hypothetical protein
MFSVFSPAFKLKHPWLDIRNESVKDDMNKMVQIRFERQFHASQEDVMSWREKVVFLSHVVPAACLFLDMMINKIKIKLGHFWFNIFGVVLYFLTALVS